MKPVFKLLSAVFFALLSYNVSSGLPKDKGTDSAFVSIKAMNKDYQFKYSQNCARFDGREEVLYAISALDSHLTESANSESLSVGLKERILAFKNDDKKYNHFWHLAYIFQKDRSKMNLIDDAALVMVVNRILDEEYYPGLMATEFPNDSFLTDEFYSSNLIVLKNLFDMTEEKEPLKKKSKRKSSKECSSKKKRRKEDDRKNAQMLSVSKETVRELNKMYFLKGLSVKDFLSDTGPPGLPKVHWAFLSHIARYSCWFSPDDQPDDQEGINFFFPNYIEDDNRKEAKILSLFYFLSMIILSDRVTDGNFRSWRIFVHAELRNKGFKPLPLTDAGAKYRRKRLKKEKLISLGHEGFYTNCFEFSTKDSLSTDRVSMGLPEYDESGQSQPDFIPDVLWVYMMAVNDAINRFKRYESDKQYRLKDIFKKTMDIADADLLYLSLIHLFRYQGFLDQKSRNELECWIQSCLIDK